MMAVVFYDIETSGISQHFDQILQFAAILTDGDLQEVERFEIRSRLLRSRERSDYQVSILEVAGSAASGEDILRMETRWKAKLQSRPMGLNGN